MDKEREELKVLTDKLSIALSESFGIKPEKWGDIAFNGDLLSVRFSAGKKQYVVTLDQNKDEITLGELG